MNRDEKRLHRQFDALARTAPPSRRLVDVLLNPRYRWVRLPAAGLLIVSGIFGLLPILGFWMLPLGLMLLALDVPPLRAPITAATIRLRRRARLWLRRLDRRGDRHDE